MLNNTQWIVLSSRKEEGVITASWPSLFVASEFFPYGFFFLLLILQCKFWENLNNIYV